MLRVREKLTFCMLLVRSPAVAGRWACWRWTCDRVPLADQGATDVANFGARSGEFRAKIRDVMIWQGELEADTCRRPPARPPVLCGEQAMLDMAGLQWANPEEWGIRLNLLQGHPFSCGQSEIRA